ncbi:DNA damage-inducible protein D [Eubacteriales bacterium SGI.150]|uniref:DNA damage-inducible protein D n=1 Tax=Intestinimonas massiliensis (ex Afouda et al. 2020) TaxID=1673721 RepID=UPI00242EFDCE|nr:DNA damage-inducible protein D [Intestinimonas massiliensis (ex Afouda et al. 2020)]MCI5563765.1 DNA damage-inducible protein D [Intestinimonas massiliensis (ex Afouda et al. 2020)]
MDKNQISKLKLIFDEIVHTTDDGVEFWYARELQSILGYSQWRRFLETIDRAKIACENSGVVPSEHFADVGKTSPMPNGGAREIGDIMLTRYACYLIAQNGDPRKDEIAFAQTYFAVQTRKQEVIEQRLADINRLQLREQLKTAEKRLSQNIYERGVDERGFGRIRSKGDKALFGGFTTDEMKQRYGIKSGPLADRLPPVTVAAKSLATEMTNLNIEEKDLQGELPITREHIQNNQGVRSMLMQRGIIPESLPPEEDIKKVERRVKSDEKKLVGQAGKITIDE